MGVTTPFAYVIDDDSVHDVATPTPGEAAADAGAASRDAEHATVVDTAEGSDTFTVPPPGETESAQLCTGVLMLATSAEEE